MTIDYGKKTLSGNGVTLKEGDDLSLNGFVGNVYKGSIKSSPSQVIQGLIENKAAGKRSDTYKKFMELMSWTDKLRKLGVRTNSDTPEQVEQAIKYTGAISLMQEMTPVYFLKLVESMTRRLESVIEARHCF